MVTCIPLTEETILQNIRRLKLSNLQTTLLSECLFIDALYFLMMILAVFWFFFFLTANYKKYASYLFYGIICIFQQGENQCKCKGPQRSVRLLTGTLANVLTSFVCSVIAQLLNQNYKYLALNYPTEESTQKRQRGGQADTEGRKEQSAYGCGRT